MSLIDPGEVVPAAELGRVHFIAIGGAGMSGVARIMLRRGIAVSGSDARDSELLAQLGDLGAKVFVGHDAAHVGTPTPSWCPRRSATPTPSWSPPARAACASCTARPRSPR